MPPLHLKRNLTENRPENSLTETVTWFLKSVWFLAPFCNFRPHRTKAEMLLLRAWKQTNNTSAHNVLCQRIWSEPKANRAAKQATSKQHLNEARNHTDCRRQRTTQASNRPSSLGSSNGFDILKALTNTLVMWTKVFAGN